MWSATTADVVKQQFTQQEAATLQNIQGATDNLPNILALVITQARGSIRAGGFPLGAEGTVPDQITNSIIDLTIWRYLKSFPQLKAFQTKDRKDAYDAAMDRLGNIANQKESIERPDDGSPSFPKASIEASANCRVASRHKMDGI